MLSSLIRNSDSSHLRLGLHTRHAVEEADGPVQHAQGTLHLQREVHVARRVDDVDAVVVPHARGGSGGDGDATLLFLRREGKTTCSLPA